MRKIKQIRENYDLVTEKEEAESKKLTTLVRAGLFDTKKLPILKRALSKDAKELTVGERKIMLELLDSLMSEVMNSKQVYDKVKQNVMREDLNEAVKEFDGYLSKYDPRHNRTPSDKDIPAVLVLKRKAIRLYPDNTKVALYYSQALDRYVTVPFGIIGAMNEAYSYSVDNRKRRDDDDDDPRYATTTYTRVKDKQKQKDFIKRQAMIRGVESKLKSGGYKDAGQQKKRVDQWKQSLSKDMSKASTEKVQKKLDLYRADQTKLSAGHQKQSIQAMNQDPNISLGQNVAIRTGLAAAKFFAKRKASKRISEERTDEAFSAIIPLVAGAARIAGAGLRALGSKAVTAGAAKVASRGARMLVRARRAARGLGSGNDGRSSSTSSQPAQAPKYSTPKEFGHLKVQTSKAEPAGDVRTGTDARDAALNRKVMMQQAQSVKEEKQNKKSSSKQFGQSKVTTSQTRPRAFRTSVDARDEILNRKAMMQQIKEASVSDKPGLVYINEDTVEINNIMAEKILSLYESLNKSNRKTMEKKLNESVDSFKKVVNFAVRQ
jgi:hypothetical protein